MGLAGICSRGQVGTAIKTVRQRSQDALIHFIALICFCHKSVLIGWSSVPLQLEPLN